MPPGERLQAGRQISGPGHAGPVHQDRDNPDTASQRGLNLHPHEVIGVVEAPPPVLISGAKPRSTGQFG